MNVGYAGSSDVENFLSTITAVLAGLTLCGCTTSPWSSGSALPVASNPSPPEHAEAATPPLSPVQPQSQRLQDVMAEVRRLGESDPASQQQLLDDLQQSDPSLWPLVVEQAKATAAYRQRVADRSMASNPAERLPAVNDVALAAHRTTSRGVSRDTFFSFRPTSAGRRNCGTSPSGFVSGTVAGDWRQRLAAAIDAMEATAADNPRTPAEIAEQARLRMLYAAAGRREDAARLIPGLPASAQHFLSKELEGFHCGSTPSRLPMPPRGPPRSNRCLPRPCRACRVRPVIGPQRRLLHRGAKLRLCQTIRQVRVPAEPGSSLIRRGQNFTSEPTAKGYHTSLRTRYRIVDATASASARRRLLRRKNIVKISATISSSAITSACPRRIGPGKYALQLSIEDLNRHKVGRASIDFQVSEPKAGTAEKADSLHQTGGGLASNS